MAVQKLAKERRSTGLFADVEKYMVYIRPQTMKLASQLESIKNSMEQTRHSFDLAFEGKAQEAAQGDELPAGVLKMVKVYLAGNCRLQPGDKMAGRHRQQGRGFPRSFQSRTCLTWLTVPCDIVLNPMGVPSRMNVGQVLEVTWVGRKGYRPGIGDMLQAQTRLPNCASLWTRSTQVGPPRRSR